MAKDGQDGHGRPQRGCARAYMLDLAQVTTFLSADVTAAFAIRYSIGLLVQLSPAEGGHYPRETRLFRLAPGHIRPTCNDATPMTWPTRLAYLIGAQSDNGTHEHGPT